MPGRKDERKMQISPCRDQTLAKRKTAEVWGRALDDDDDDDDDDDMEHVTAKDVDVDAFEHVARTDSDLRSCARAGRCVCKAARLIAIKKHASKEGDSNVDIG
jgi:hypothetical protein